MLPVRRVSRSAAAVATSLLSIPALVLSAAGLSTLLYTLASPAAAQEPQLVADLNPGAWEVARGGLCDRWTWETPDEFGGVVFADTLGDRCDIFTVDLAAGSVNRAASLGEVGAAVDHYLGTAGGMTYFIGVTAAEKKALWSTDGTTAGTRLLLDPYPGPGSGPGSVGSFVAAVPWSYFVAWTPETGGELWRTDGTSAGTAMVRDIQPGPESSSIGGWVAWEDLLLFTVSLGESVRVWRTDGSSGGTVPITPELDPWNDAIFYAALPDAVVFAATSTGPSLQLWRSDGSEAGTAPIWTHPDGGGFVDFLVANGTRALLGTREGNGLVALWVTDGTPAGTLPVVTLPNGGSTYVQFPTPIGDSWLFFYYDWAHGVEPWITDGTAEGTHFLVDVRPGPASSMDYNYYESPPVPLGDRLLMLLVHDTYGQELWVTDGTAAGTTLVRDLTPGPDHSSIRTLGERDGRELLLFDEALWRTDGTEAGTMPLADLRFPQWPSEPEALTAAGDLLYFNAWEGAFLRAAARSDGTASGTYFLSGESGAAIAEAFTSLADGTVIGATGVVYGAEKTVLWSSAGASVLPLTAVSFPCGHHFCGLGYLPPAAAHGAVFNKWSASAGNEPWVTDGTVAGTHLLADVLEGTASARPEHVQAAGEAVWFTAVDEEDVEHLWTTDGTAAGTARLAALSGEPGRRAGVVWPADAEVGSFYFTEFDDDGPTFWFVSGQQATPVLVLSGIDPIEPIGRLGDRLLFSATEYEDTGAGVELWASDGTPAGTDLLRDIWAGPADSGLVPGVELGGRLFFRACDAEAGCELWVSDGTAEGTERFLDLQPGPRSSAPFGLTRIDNRIWFAACQVATGCEAWATDGTVEGTGMLAEVTVGESSSLSRHENELGNSFDPATPRFIRAGGNVYFAGDDGTGAELWAYSLVLFVDGFESGDTSRWDVP